MKIKMNTTEYNNNMDVECSPKTYHRLQTDQEYRDLFTQDLIQSQGNEFIPNIVIRSRESDPNVEAVGEVVKDVWLEAPTKLLLSLVEDLRPKVGKTFDLKKQKTKMWQLIQKKLFDEGYTFTVAQVQGKYRSLERRYKTTKMHNKRTGRKRETCPYQSELDKVLSEKRGIHPEYILDNEAQDGLAREDLIANESFFEANTSSTSENSSGSALKGKRKCESTQEKIVKRIDEIGKESADYHSEVIKFLDHRKKCDNERNELLKAILDKF